ncbi:hypothetical protein [Clostridium celatum]|uniref:hypothetical protein n=3 Tax=Clostridium celatum TaxID=36834 RepID=UPI00319E3AEE
MIAFTYLCILLFIIIFIFYLMYLNNKKSPKKIKLVYSIALLTLLLRYISLVVLWIVEKQSIIYSMKSLTQTNYIAIPLLALIALYIFLRMEDKSFDYNYVFTIILIISYVIIIKIYKLDIKIDSVFGFIVRFKEILVPSLIYLIILASIMIITLLLGDKPYSNKKGMRLLMISLIVLIGEFIMFVSNMMIFPYNIVGEVFMLICSYNAINTFKIR